MFACLADSDDDMQVVPQSEPKTPVRPIVVVEPAAPARPPLSRPIRYMPYGWKPTPVLNTISEFPSLLGTHKNKKLHTIWESTPASVTSAAVVTHVLARVVRVGAPPAVESVPNPIQNPKLAAGAWSRGSTAVIKAKDLPAPKAEQKVIRYAAKRKELFENYVITFPIPEVDVEMTKVEAEAEPEVEAEAPVHDYGGWTDVAEWNSL